MKTTTTNLSALVVLSYFIATITLAKEIIMFTHDNVPSAEEMANILLNNTSQKNTLNKIKTRSISFGVLEKNKPVHIGLPIKFNFNSSALNSESLPHLKQLGLMLNLEDIANESIMIIGHTDTTGTENYNLNLSIKRAQAVKQFLISNHLVDATRIKTSGKGESDILPGTPGNAAINRRVEVHHIQ